MELIISPQLLFLDEPTSGLDANTANSVIKFLSRYCPDLAQLTFTKFYFIHKLFCIPNIKQINTLILLNSNRITLSYVCEIYHSNQNYHISFSISKRGRTIIFSIHQPRYSILRLFDSLLLLSHGKTVYHGPASDTLDYFTKLGKHHAHFHFCDYFNFLWLCIFVN